MANPIICSSVANPTGCATHRVITVNGQAIPVQKAALAPLNLIELEQFRELAFRHLGVSIDALAGRVLHGIEATNVKIYPFFGPGAAITKTNIGASYVNICPGLNGERTIVDLTGCTEYRLIMHANLIGTGAFGARIVRDSDNVVLHESANLGAAGERELDSDWQPLPAAFLNAGLVYLRAQAKSVTAADDPVFRSLKLGLR